MATYIWGIHYTYTLGTQSLTVLSLEDEAIKCPDGENFTERTASYNKSYVKICNKSWQKMIRPRSLIKDLKKKNYQLIHTYSHRKRMKKGKGYPCISCPKRGQNFHTCSLERPSPSG